MSNFDLFSDKESINDFSNSVFLRKSEREASDEEIKKEKESEKEDKREDKKEKVSENMLSSEKNNDKIIAVLLVSRRIALITRSIFCRVFIS